VTFDDQLQAQIAAAATLDELADLLERLLSSGVMVVEGQLMHIRAEVDRVCGLRISVHPREHGVPHFHVYGNGIDAVFTIADCSLLEGRVDRRNANLIRWWYRGAALGLARKWNETRPADCPVGLINLASLRRPA
jgi:hypothetical protein